MTEPAHYSHEMQDLAALKLFGNVGKTFLDIGCSHPVKGNNTLLLEKNGWEGICVDIEDFSKEYTKERSSPFYQVDVTSQEFVEILSRHFPTKIIDYISLDVDGSSLMVLENLLKNEYIFRFMTFEHDLHWVLNHRGHADFGSEREWRCFGRTPEQIENCKYKSKALLRERGFALLFENVSFYESNKFPHPWEDWWINPSAFNFKSRTVMERIKSKNIHFRDCVERIFLISK